LWAEARTGPRRTHVDWTNPQNPDFDLWARRKDDMVSRWRAVVANASTDGPTYVWGAGAKGVSFSCMFDPQATLLTGLVDINPNKQGTFAAMTGCPIVSPASIRPHPAIIVMNPNYEAEVRAVCDARGLNAKITAFGKKAPD
jgi:hypothetical protein